MIDTLTEMQVHHNNFKRGWAVRGPERPRVWRPVEKLDWCDMLAITQPVKTTRAPWPSAYPPLDLHRRPARRQTAKPKPRPRRTVAPIIRPSAKVEIEQARRANAAHWRAMDEPNTPELEAEWAAALAPDAPRRDGWTLGRLYSLMVDDPERRLVLVPEIQWALRPGAQGLRDVPPSLSFGIFTLLIAGWGSAREETRASISRVFKHYRPLHLVNAASA